MLHDVALFMQCYITPDGRDFYDLGKPTGQTRIISLSRDVVLPNLFSSTQFGKALLDIGSEQRWSFSDYHGWVWEPIGILMLEDRNCSVIPDILQRVGEIEIHHVYDISAVYEFVHCDGNHFVRSWDGKVIAPVFDVAFAAIFEIGRMILNQRNGRASIA